MKMTFLATVVTAVLFSSFTFTNPVLEDKTIDIQKSTVEWKAYKLGGSHYGTVDIETGSVQLTDGVLVGGQFTMDMTSMIVTDISGGGKESLEGHLSSADFFNTAEFKTADLKITSVNYNDNGRYTIEADVTIKNTTQAVTFEATGNFEDGNFSASAAIKLDRSKFDVRYGSPSFFDDLGDKVIYDDFDINVNIVTK